MTSLPNVGVSRYAEPNQRSSLSWERCCLKLMLYSNTNLQETMKTKCNSCSTAALSGRPSLKVVLFTSEKATHRKRPTKKQLNNEVKQQELRSFQMKIQHQTPVWYNVFSPLYSCPRNVRLTTKVGLLCPPCSK